MAATILLNPDATLASLKASLNAEMTAAAEPIIQAALVEIEKAMRARLAHSLVTLIDSRMSLMTNGEQLTIVVDRRGH